MNKLSSVMQECIAYAYTHSLDTRSNPKVAAALVDDDNNIIAISAHKEYGSKHAEIELLDSVGDRSRGGRVFLTLEPCSTTGKTPPCVDRLISAGVKEVVIALLDPNPKNNLEGTKKLVDAGIKVVLGIESESAAKLIEDFIKVQSSEIPYISAKLAMSIDGMIATNTGESKWITGDRSRKYVHKLRQSVGAIITGIGTVRYDDPMLNCRLGETSYQPTRIILDSKLSISPRSKIVQTAKDYKTIIFTDINTSIDSINKISDFGVKVERVEKTDNGYLDIYQILKRLKELDIINIMIEAGSKLLGTFNDNNLIDRYYIFLAPMIMGGERSFKAIGGKGFGNLSDIKRFSSYKIEDLDGDIFINASQQDYTTSIVEQSYEIRDKLCLQ